VEGGRGVVCAFVLLEVRYVDLTLVMACIEEAGTNEGRG
jgi:hypothetical protein